MATIIPKLQGLHLYIPGQRFDGNYLADSWADTYDGGDDPVPEAMGYKVPQAGSATIQIIDSEAVADPDYSPFGCEIVKWDGTTEGDTMGWIAPIPNGTVFTYPISFGDIKSAGADSFFLRLHARVTTGLGLLEYDRLSFNSATSYFSGPSNTTSHETVITQSGAGSCQIDLATGGTIIGGDHVILRLPDNTLSAVTTTNLVRVGGYIYMTASPRAGCKIAFNPLPWFADAQVLHVKSWADGDAIDRWVYIETIFRVIGVPANPTVGIVLHSSINSVTGAMTPAVATSAVTMYTDTWAVYRESREDYVAVSEVVCVEEHGPSGTIKVRGSCDGDKMGLVWDDHEPSLYVRGSFRRFSWDFRDSASETDSEGVSVMASAQARKVRQLQAGPMPEWMADMLALTLLCDTVYINEVPYVSTGEGPEIEQDDARGILSTLEANLFPKEWPYCTK